MKLEVAVTHSFVSKVIKELEKEGLVKVFQKRSPKESIYNWRRKGKSIQMLLSKKYSVLEKYFKQRRSEEEVIRATNILEHCISTEVIDNIKKYLLSKRKAFP